MKTLSIEPGGTVSFQVHSGLYLAQSMVSIKAAGTLEKYRRQDFLFTIKFYKDSFRKVGFHFPLYVESPYHFGAASPDPSTVLNAYQGPYCIIEIESSKENPPLVIQVGFSNRLS